MTRWLIGGMLALFGATCWADEGMWLFNRPPTQLVEEKYGFELDEEWLDHLRESSVRFSSGGSGAFVSGKGLLLTNHHVGAGVIASLSTAERDLIQDGFLARKREDELPCRDLELNVLVSIRDVTTEVQAAVTDDLDTEAAVMKRRAVIAKLEAVGEMESARLRRDVVTLYQGGAYHLYEYRRYTDVRLVFAPENQVGAYGGDADNFEFPRYCLDFCFFRAYEDGEPARVEDFLRWSEGGAQENELVFVSGHPGSTDRGLTHAQVKAMRDVQMPFRLEMLKRREVLLTAWGSRDVENRRRAKRPLIGIQNGRKATDGRLAGLLGPKFMKQHRAAEMAFFERLAGRADGKDAAEAFDEIERVLARQQEDSLRGSLIGGGAAFDSQLFGLAQTLVRVADERAKPDEERRSGFRDADRVSLELRLFSEDPIYKDMEELRLADSLSFMCEKLGAEDPTVVRVLAGRSPRARARELVLGCGLDQVKLRKSLYVGGDVGIKASTDPMIDLARAINEEVQTLRERYEQDGEILKQCHERISRARFALDGETGYPDATFSLRLSFGTVKGIGEEEIPFQTTYAGLFEREKSQLSTPPFDLPERWMASEGKIDGDVGLNFISTHDITGGNSGSPMVNKSGELVGLIFDSNIDGLTNDVAYDGTRGRAVSVDSAGIMHALEMVYEAVELVAELKGNPRVD